MNKSSPIILACDTEEISSVIQFIEQTSQYVGVYKLGLEFFLAQGAQGVSEIQNQFPGVRIFLDLKLHDIPNTVSKAAKTIEKLAPEFLTVHAAGGDCGGTIQAESGCHEHPPGAGGDPAGYHH